MQIELRRFAYLTSATLGVLSAGLLTLATLEEPWAPNPSGPGGRPQRTGQRGACVPDGTYDLLVHNTPRHPHVWALSNPSLGVYANAVPAGQPWGRAACLIHAGNTVADSEGCILVGTRHASTALSGTFPELEESARALTQLQELLGPVSHTLIIRPIAGTQEVPWAA